MTFSDLVRHPYRDLEDRAFWSRSVALGTQVVYPELFRPQFQINQQDRIVTAGSCFAQHIGRYLLRMGLRLLDLEPPPRGLSLEQSEAHGFGLFSARYGNIYTTRQLRCLVEEATGERSIDIKDIAWERKGRWWDALRPTIEPKGWESPEEIAWHRAYHLKKVGQLLQEMDVFIFTMGLTECWTSADRALAFPLAPGIIAGEFDSSLHMFHQLSQAEIVKDVLATLHSLRRWRRGRPLRLLLTVSPVPLVATYSGNHVLTATMASKATLLSAAFELIQTDPQVDYFPSFEIVTNPWLGIQAFASNQRSVTPEAVEQVMQIFAGSFGLQLLPLSMHVSEKSSVLAARDAQCDEILTDIFSRLS